MISPVLILLCLTKNIIGSSELRLCSEETNPNHICKLDENYNNLKVPAKKVQMNSSITLYDIVEIDEVDHSITIYIKVHIYWHDQRLNPSNMTKE